jgi:hypothetical protein
LFPVDAGVEAFEGVAGFAQFFKPVIFVKKSVLFMG